MTSSLSLEMKNLGEKFLSLTLQLSCLSAVGKSNSNHEDAENSAEGDHAVAARPKKLCELGKSC